MAAPVGPTVRRMQLGFELERLRRRAGFDTRAKALKGLKISEPKLHRVEKGVTALQSSKELKTLLTRYGVTDPDDVEFLCSIQRESHQKGWWTPYRGVMPSGMDTYVGLEYGAHTAHAWQPDVVHGLLQTEAYARGLFLTAKHPNETTTQFIERSVQVRIERKARLEKEEVPLNLWVVLDEAALRRMVGSVEVMREQYAEIERLARLDNVSVQILQMKTFTFRTGSNFMLLDFDDPLPTIVQEDGMGAVILHDTDLTAFQCLRRFDALRAGALPVSETPQYLRQLSREITA